MNVISAMDSMSDLTAQSQPGECASSDPAAAMSGKHTPGASQGSYSQRAHKIAAGLSLMSANIADSGAGSITLIPSYISLVVTGSAAGQAMEISASGYGVGLLSEYSDSSGYFASLEAQAGRFSFRQEESSKTTVENGRSYSFGLRSGRRLEGVAGGYAAIPSLMARSTVLETGERLSVRSEARTVGLGLDFERRLEADERGFVKFGGGLMRQSSELTMDTGERLQGKLPESLLRLGVEVGSSLGVDSLGFSAGADYARSVFNRDYSAVTLRMNVDLSW